MHTNTAPYRANRMRNRRVFEFSCRCSVVRQYAPATNLGCARCRLTLLAIWQLRRHPRFHASGAAAWWCACCRRNMNHCMRALIGELFCEITEWEYKVGRMVYRPIILDDFWASTKVCGALKSIKWVYKKSRRTMIYNNFDVLFMAIFIQMFQCLVGCPTNCPHEISMQLFLRSIVQKI